MPKSDTVDEFAALMADILNAAGAENVTQLVPAPQPVVSVAVETPVAEKADKPADGKAYRPPVAKTAIDFPGCPFAASIADEKKYLNVQFSKFSKAFLYYDQVEKLVRFCQTHGDQFLAYLKANGVK